MKVRQKVDQLASEPPVGDLGYPADQRLVASLMLGLQLLADEIDDMRRHPVQLSESPPTEAQSRQANDTVYEVDGEADVATQLLELTEQLKKLTKAVKKASKRR